MALVIEYHEELEVDLANPATGPVVDLLDLWRGTLSFRRLDLLIRHLPPESEFVKSVAPDAAFLASWRAGDYIAADLFDLFARAHFQKPQPYPRPGWVVEKRRTDDARRAALIEKYEARQRSKSRGSG